MRIHCVAACWVVWFGHLCALGKGEWAALAVACGTVISCELFNTSLEAAVDLLSPQYHTLARRAKDVSAAGVLVGALFAVVTGGIVFGDRLPLLWGWLTGLAGHPARLAAVLSCALLSLAFIFAYPRLFHKRT